MSNNSTAPVNKPSYRKDIDGLRAIAVLSVVIFHLNPLWLPGGYLGVDIFFVISGYLITSIIYRDISDTKFNFADFYVRRIKRILPVFFVALSVGLALAYSSFMRNDAIQTGTHAQYAIGFASNILSARSAGGYFDPSSEEKIFLHIWSLSVEEQFYFVFPILLIILLKFQFTRRYIITILTSLGIISLLSSFFPLEWVGLEHLDTYYLPHLRFVEMLTGALLAIAIARGFSLHLSRYIIVIAMIVLLGLFYVAGNNLFKPPFFPGIFALLPCLATAVILYPSKEENPISRFLSLGPVVWIGKISYSLYLWHWIVLAYIRYMGDTTEPLSPSMYLFAVLCMLLLSIASYYLVEQPTRHLSLSFRSALLRFYVLPSLLCIGAIWLLNRYMPQLDLEKDITEWKITQQGDGENLWGVHRGNPLGKTTVLIAGDSHTLSLLNFFDVIGKHEGWQGFVSSIPGCPFLFDYTYELSGDLKDKKHNEDREQYLRSDLDKYNTIILPCYWGSKLYHKDWEAFSQGIDRTLEQLTKMGKKVIVINTLYHIKRDVIRSYNSPRLAALMETISLSESPTRGTIYYQSKDMAQRVKKIIDRYPSVRWVDLEPYLPETGLVNDKPIYSDKDHVNPFGAGYLAERFLNSSQTLVN